MNTKTASSYISGLKNPSTKKDKANPCGTGCADIPVNDVGPGEVVPVRQGDGGMAGKGGRGKGASSKSNYGPSADVY